MNKLLEIIRSAARLVRGYVAQVFGPRKPRLISFGKATGTECLPSFEFRRARQEAIRAPKAGNLDAMMVSSWSLATEKNTGRIISNSFGGAFVMRCPKSLSDQEATHILAGGLVVFKADALYPGARWGVVFPITEEDFPEGRHLPGINGGLFVFCLTDEEGSQAIEAELRRRAMTAVINAACPDTEISEPPVTAPRRRRIGV